MVRAIYGAFAVCCSAVLCMAAAVSGTSHATTSVNAANAATAANAANTAYVQALFEEALHHPPQPNQLAAFTTALNNGMSRVAVAKTIVASPEFRTNVINQYYSKFLGRSDASATRFANSTAPFAQIAKSILSSPEYYARKGGKPTGFVSGLYLDLVGRLPGKEVVVTYLDGNPDRPIVVGTVWNSSEAAQFRINDYFLTYTGHAGTSAQTATLASRLAAGGTEEDALADILSYAPPGKKP
jgi:hypothetical protein